MNGFVLKGNICYSESPEKIRLLPQYYAVCEDGICVGVFEQLPQRYAALPLKDHGDRIIIPGMVDLHLHAPQFSFRGLGMDRELLDWLNTYAFPEEAKYSDLAYADLAYGQFVSCLKRSATTRAAVFATIHAPATLLLMEKLEESGIISYVGKVNMNRNCPDTLSEGSAEQALACTEEWICRSRERFRRCLPILTPRFIPSCTDEVMRGLRRLVETYHLPVQSHLSENAGEIAWVRELCPQSEFYGDAYDSYGLFGGDHPCIMAHCVHSSDRELELMKKNGVYVAHSPLSNSNLASGVAPVSRYLEHGLNVALASDMAGGETENMFRVMTAALRASNLRWRLQDQQTPALTVDQAFYIATLGGGGFFGKVGSFAPGYEFDAVVLDDSTLEHPQELSLRQRLERLLYLGDDRQIREKYAAGRQII